MPADLTRYDCPETEAAVRALFPRAGSYQLALLRGSTSWAGSGLSGTARQWSARYADTRRDLIARIERAGFAVEWSTVDRWRVATISAVTR